MDRQIGEYGVLAPEDLRREVAAGMFAAGSVYGGTDAGARNGRCERLCYDTVVAFCDICARAILQLSNLATPGNEGILPSTSRNCIQLIACSLRGLQHPPGPKTDQTFRAQRHFIFDYRLNFQGCRLSHRAYPFSLVRAASWVYGDT